MDCYPIKDRQSGEKAMKDFYQIFFSNSSKLEKIRTFIEDIAKTELTILIKGEKGTGKELVAQAIHSESQRHEKPFIKVNCAAIPKGILESELFGFEKGAFAGAALKKPGKFELANGGTLLLNEIGELDISLQGKLLQVLQDGELVRLGGDRSVPVDTRVITTTTDHLEKSMQEGRFRQDLFYRVNVMSITIPPLRDRREQIFPLTQYFFDLYRAKYEKELPALSLRTLGTFKSYEWPGNIRELESMVKRIVLFGDEMGVVAELTRKKSPIKVTHGPVDCLSAKHPRGEGVLNLREVSKRAVENAEKEMIHNTLKETRWNRKDAARLLGVSCKSLANKIEKYRLDKGLELSWNGEEGDEKRPR